MTRVEVIHTQPERRPDYRGRMALEAWRQWRGVAASHGPNPATRDEARVRTALLTDPAAYRSLVSLMGTSDGREWVQALALMGRTRLSRTPTARPITAAPSPGRMFVHGAWRA